jgi:carboxymethylenebutenolidase
LQKAGARFESKGLRIASVSYDTPATLRAFADRSHITFSLLADPGSNLIRRFRMIDPDNTENNVPSYGMKDAAYPGYFVVNPSGVIVERFVDERYDDRRTGNDVVATMFPELIENRGRPIAAPHIQVTLGQTDSRVTLGAHLRLLVGLTLPRGMHVYAPGVQGYRPVELTLDSSSWFTAKAPQFPRSKTLTLKAIHETVPVFEKQADITVDIVVANTTALMRTIAGAQYAPQAVAVTGHLKYQACDDTVCYLPAEVPVTWTIEVGMPDRTRVTSGPPSDATASLVLAAVADAGWRDIPTPAGVVRTWVAGAGDDRRPAILFVHPGAGLNPWARAAAAALSTEGFRVFAPDLLSGKGPGGGGWESMRDFQTASAAVSALDRTEIQTRLDGVLDAALAAPSARAAIVGFSWGGTEAFAYAARQPRLAGAVIFYGLPPTPDLLAGMSVPVLGLYGSADDFVTPTVRDTETIMGASSASYVAKIFPGAVHGFVPRQEAGGGPNTTAAAEAWREMLAFLRSAMR